jgi:hypothetical protein
MIGNVENEGRHNLIGAQGVLIHFTEEASCDYTS